MTDTDKKDFYVGLHSEVHEPISCAFGLFIVIPRFNGSF